MTDHAARNADGARDTVALLEALVRNDVAGAQAVLSNCDPEPTIFCLASAWIGLAREQGLDPLDLIAHMRKSIGGAP